MYQIVSFDGNGVIIAHGVNYQTRIEADNAVRANESIGCYKRSVALGYNEYLVQCWGDGVNVSLPPEHEEIIADDKRVEWRPWLEQQAEKIFRKWAANKGGKGSWHVITQDGLLYGNYID